MAPAAEVAQAMAAAAVVDIQTGTTIIVVEVQTVTLNTKETLQSMVGMITGSLPPFPIHILYGHTC